MADNPEKSSDTKTNILDLSTLALVLDCILAFEKATLTIGRLNNHGALSQDLENKYLNRFEHLYSKLVKLLEEHPSHAKHQLGRR